MKLTRLSTLAVTAIALIAFVYSGCKSEQKIALSFAPQKGKKYEFEMNTVQDIEMEQMGQKINSKNTMAFTYQMTVAEKDANKNTVMVTTFKRIRFASQNPMMTMEYDSDKPTEEGEDMSSAMIGKVFGSMLNKEITLVVNDKGEVTSLKGMEAIFLDIIKDMGLDSMPEGAATIASLKAQLSDEQFKKSFDEMFRILPGREVKIGESWDVESDKNMMNMNVKTKNTYTLKDVKDKTATVSVASNIDITKTGDEMQGGEMKMTGTQTGTMSIDLETGFPTSSNITQDISATTKAMGMEMPMKLKGSIIITSKEIK